jgi:hypothetical protein
MRPRGARGWCSPNTDAYPTQAGLSQDKFLERFGGALSAEVAGRNISELAANDAYTDAAYVLGLSGLRSVNWS